MSPTGHSGVVAEFLRTFGAPALLDGNGRDVPALRKKDLALLIYLCVEGPRRHSRSALASMLWGDGSEEKARHSLTQALRRVRSVLPPGAIEAHDDVVEWRGPLASDARSLEDAAAGRGEDVGAAARLYTSDLLRDFSPGKGASDFELWADGKREAYRVLALQILDRLGQEAEERGAWAEALELGRRAAEIEPIFEEAQRRAMRAWRALGERTIALEHYERFAKWLREELDAEPDPATQRLAAELRTAPQPMPAISSGVGTAGPTAGERGPRYTRGSEEPGEPPPAPSAGRASAPETAAADPVAATTLSSERAPEQRLAAEVGATPERAPTPGRTRRRRYAVSVRTAAVVGVAGAAALGVLAAGVRVLGGDDRASFGIIADLDASLAAAGEERIVFLSNRDGVDRLYTMRPDGSDMALLAAEFDPLELRVHVAPDRRHAAFGRLVGEDSEVFVVGVRGRDTVNLTRRQGQDNLGAWSPDGRRLLITSYRDRNADLFVTGPDGSDEKQLTDHPADDDQPCWSPDGSQIVFRSRRGGMRELWIMDADGRRPRRLAAGEPAGCRFSPDGRWISFALRDAPRVEPFVVRRDGSGLRRLSDGTYSTIAPAWSPDGRWLAFTTDRDGDHEVYRLRLEDGVLENLTRDTADDRLVAWLPVPRPSYIERVDVAAPSTVPMAPGERRVLSARAFDAEGRYFYAAPIRWESVDTAVAIVDSTGVVTGRAPGRALVVASAGGWRSDTLSLLVDAREPALLLAEDFEAGLDTTIWEPFGTPPPYVAAGIGYAGSRGFVNNGDDYYESGAISHASFPPDQGITVEFNGRAPLTSPTQQEFTVDLVAVRLDSLWRTQGHVFGGPGAVAPLRFKLIALADGGAAPQILFGFVRVPLPDGAAPGEWHRYTLQLRPDAYQELYIDGRFLAISPPLQDGAPLRAVRLALGSRSHGTRLVHDDVAVYRGLKHTPPPGALPRGLNPGSAAPPANVPPDATTDAGTCRPGEAQAVLVDEIYAAGAQIRPGMAFTKSWMLQNAGTCTWGSGFALHHVGSERVRLSTSIGDVRVGGRVPPGGVHKFDVPMLAPTSPGTYSEEWELRDDGGRRVRLGTAQRLAAHIVVPAPHPPVCGPGAATATLMLKKYPEGAVRHAGERFTYSWTLRNPGACAWQAAVYMAYSSHALERLSMTDRSAIATRSVAPGEAYTFLVPMRAPTEPRVYHEAWELRDKDGTVILVDGVRTVEARMRVAPRDVPITLPPVCAPGEAKVRFVDESYPDDTRVPPGTTFIKRWTVLNSGPCTWPTGYRLRYASNAGAMLSISQADMPLLEPVPQWTAYTFEVSMRAPVAPGTYREDWQLVDAAGTPIKVSNSSTVWAQIVVER